MGIYKDITIFCDRCLIEGVGTTSAKECRKEAKASGWTKRKVEGIYIDLCPDCRFKEFKL